MNNIVFNFTAPKKLELVKEGVPELKDGHILCKTICSMISIGTEMICFAREVEPGSHWDEWIQYPFTPGYISVGTVEETTAVDSKYKKGDIVCSFAPHRQWFIDDEKMVFPVPDGISPEEGAWFVLNLISQNGVRLTEPKLGEDAVVIGLGPLGQLAVRFLSLMGMTNLIAVDPMEARCALAEKSSPTAVLNCYADAAVQQVMDATNGKGADIVFDITGHPAVFHAAHHMLTTRGRLGLIGDVPKPHEQTLTADVISKSISIIGAHTANTPAEGNAYCPWGKQEMVAFFFEMIKQKRIDVQSLITDRITPQEAPEFYNHLYDNRAEHMGVIIDW